MTTQKRTLDDILSLAATALDHFANAREGLKTCAKDHARRAANDMDLVSRDEFDAAFAMLAKARDVQEDLCTRVSKIESVLRIKKTKKAPQKKVKTPTRRLPSVKKRKTTKASK